MSALILPEHLKPAPTPVQFKLSPRKMLGSEIAVSKLLAYLTTVPDPDEMLRRAGIQRHQLRQLEADDEVAQCVETRRDAVVATPWRIEPNQDRAGKFLAEVLEPFMEDVLKGAMEARYYGYSVQEIVFAKVPKGIGVDRILLKPMEWFKPQPDGTLLFFPDDGSGGVEGVEVDPNKFLLTRCNATYRNPYGEALLSKLYFPVTWRREGWGMWLQFLETFGEPIVLGQMADYEAFVEAMTAQGVRSTIGFQSVTDSDKITTINASTPGEFDRLESAIIRRIEKLILGQTLTSDSSKTGGSYALGAVHHRVLDSKRLSDLRLIRHTGQHLVDVLCELNRLKPHRFIQVDDAGLETARAQRDAILTPVLAASGLKLTKGYFLDHYDYLEDSLEERQEPTPEAPERDPDETPEVTPEQAVQQPPVADRSVADMSAFEFKDRSVVHLTNEIHWPEGTINKSEPLSINLTQDAQPINISVTMPEQAAPNVQVHVPEQAAPVVNFTAPEQKNEVVVHVPEQAAPVVHFNIPDPNVTVNVAAPNVSVTPEVSVKLGTRQTLTEVERDSQGQIVKTRQVESDLDSKESV